MRRVYIETYGCQMNVADSELIVGVLVREGFVRTDDPAAADVLLVNTCAVRDHAEQRVLSRLGELKGFKRPGRVLGVVGCMAQRLGPRLLERVPQVDLVIGPDGYRGLPELIARAHQGERAAEVEFKTWEHYEDVPPARRPRASTCICRCRAAARACSSGCCGATTASGISPWWQRCAAPCPASRLRPTSSSGSPARWRTTSRRLCPSWKRSASTTPTPSSTRRARG